MVYGHVTWGSHVGYNYKQYNQSTLNAGIDSSFICFTRYDFSFSGWAIFFSRLQGLLPRMRVRRKWYTEERRLKEKLNLTWYFIRLTLFYWYIFYLLPLIVLIPKHHWKWLLKRYKESCSLLLISLIFASCLHPSPIETL